MGRDVAGIILDEYWGMNPGRSHRNGDLVRWQFDRRGQRVTCAVSARGRRRFEVMMLAHGNLHSAVIETYRAAVDALRRHASIASHLRSRGWQVSAYTA